jgi:hypothetical protein
MKDYKLRDLRASRQGGWVWLKSFFFEKKGLFHTTNMGKFVESSGFVYNGKAIYKMGTLYKEGKLSSIFKVKGTRCT